MSWGSCGECRAEDVYVKRGRPLTTHDRTAGIDLISLKKRLGFQKFAKCCAPGLCPGVNSMFMDAGLGPMLKRQIFPIEKPNFSLLSPHLGA